MFQLTLSHAWANMMNFDYVDPSDAICSRHGLLNAERMWDEALEHVLLLSTVSFSRETWGATQVKIGLRLSWMCSKFFVARKPCILQVFGAIRDPSLLCIKSTG